MIPIRAPPEVMSISEVASMRWANGPFGKHPFDVTVEQQRRRGARAMSSASDIRVSPEELRGAATRFQQHMTQLEGTLQTMQQQISSLEGDWAGAAQQAFVQLMGQWTHDYDDMLQVLQRVKQLLESAAESFSSQDTQFANVLNQILGG